LLVVRAAHQKSLEEKVPKRSVKSGLSVAFRPPFGVLADLAPATSFSNWLQLAAFASHWPALVFGEKSNNKNRDEQKSGRVKLAELRVKKWMKRSKFTYFSLRFFPADCLYKSICAQAEHRQSGKHRGTLNENENWPRN